MTHISVEGNQKIDWECDNLMWQTQNSWTRLLFSAMEILKQLPVTSA